MAMTAAPWRDLEALTDQLSWLRYHYAAQPSPELSCLTECVWQLGNIDLWCC